MFAISRLANYIVSIQADERSLRPLWSDRESIITVIIANKYLAKLGGTMRAKNRLAQLEARLNTLEEVVNQFRARSDQATATACVSHSPEPAVLSGLRSYIGHQFAVQADRLAALNLKLDMTHSRVERLDRIQDEIHQAQEENTGVLTEILERLPDRELIE
jgi:hypothetical protein